jgi:hypothetical protein
MDLLHKLTAAGLGASLLGMALAHADINVGVTLSTTGPAASLGVPEKNTFAFMPATIAGQKISIVLDDASDTTTAVRTRASCSPGQRRRDRRIDHHPSSPRDRRRGRKRRRP